jgi:hypothetical protein
MKISKTINNSVDFQAHQVPAGCQPWPENIQERNKFEKVDLWKQNHTGVKAKRLSWKCRSKSWSLLAGK